MNLSHAIYHNSRDLGFRSPFGAMEAETKITLRLRVSESLDAKKVTLRSWQDKSGETLVDMEKSDFDGKYFVKLDAASTGCLMWYYFIIDLKDGKRLYYGNNERQLGGEGKVYEHEPPSYQITVYDKGAKTPDWFKDSIMYQIFPDRFNRKETGNLPKKSGAVFHMDWYDSPSYYKDPDTREITAYDFYGGNLAGIEEKLPYLKELGISVIYMNPIFKAASNHRYDTGDYHQVDPLLGTNDDLKRLCDKADALGIKIILDGVFSHTGSDSKYFNRYGNYDSLGAYQSEKSPYKEWYDFTNYPDEYSSWWGFTTLPDVRETTPSYMDFIIYNKDSVLNYWLNKGISGWRLDVIDELPPEFSRAFYKELKAKNPDSVLIGEVWEDASNKNSYGVSREYLSGHEMDSAMNYPFRKALLDFLIGWVDAAGTYEVLYSLYENYPTENFYAMMNLIDSHDVERALTVFGEAPSAENVPAIRQAEFKLADDKYALAVKRLKMASLWQMTFPGVPCIYYGDEIGMQGYRDPYNRRPYPWGREDEGLKAWYKKIIALRKDHRALVSGELKLIYCGSDIFGYIRRIYNGKDALGKNAEDDAYLILFNRNKENTLLADVDLHGIFSGELECVAKCGADELNHVCVRGGRAKIAMPPLSAAVYRMNTPPKFPRRAGVLLHPTSLPSKNDIGDMGKEAYKFVDYLAEAKQTLWQVLPLNPVAFGDSPYQSPSAFAGNPSLISLDELVKDGWLKQNEIKPCKGRNFAEVLDKKAKILHAAYKKFKSRLPKEYKDFCNKESYWLDDYALYMALRDKYRKPWYDWPSDIKKKLGAAVAREKTSLKEEIGYYKFEQYVFSAQWGKLKAYANSKDIQIIGDIPIFVAHDSADVWANQSEFLLDRDGNPEKVAGVPPDYFSATGQLWGNPHYRWDVMKKTGYRWWKNRFRCILESVDIIRVDHFRGFEAYWAVNAGEETAVNGEWIKGPADDLFEAIEDEFGSLPIIAEDLGLITDEVNELKDRLALPGMRLLHFYLQHDENGTAYFECAPNTIAYTGTHDNNTTAGWYEENLSEYERAGLRKMLKVSDDATPEEICDKLIEYLYKCNASTVIVPMQDILRLGSKSRMNTPGSFGGANWHWRLAADYYKKSDTARLAKLVCDTGRQKK